MTYDEYIKESNRIKNEYKTLEKISIVFATILIILTAYNCYNKCSESVYSFVVFLNFCIWGLLGYIHSLTKCKIELKLKALYEQLNEEDKVFCVIAELTKRNPFV